MKYPEIAKRFEYIMNLRNVKQVDLVNKTGISKASINQYVKGVHCPENDRAMLLAEALNVNPMWLMGFDVPMDEPIIHNNLPDNLKRYAQFISLYTQLNDDNRELVDNMIQALTSKQ